MFKRKLTVLMKNKFLKRIFWFFEVLVIFRGEDVRKGEDGVSKKSDRKSRNGKNGEKRVSEVAKANGGSRGKWGKQG